MTPLARAMLDAAGKSDAASILQALEEIERYLMTEDETAAELEGRDRASASPTPPPTA